MRDLLANRDDHRAETHGAHFKWDLWINADRDQVKYYSVLQAKEQDEGTPYCAAAGAFGWIQVNPVRQTNEQNDACSDLDAVLEAKDGGVYFGEQSAVPYQEGGL